MRRKLIAGNWKMNLTAVEARAVIAGIRAEIDRDAAALARDRDIMIAPPAVIIPAAAQALAGSSIALGAQNSLKTGRVTGEISAPVLLPFKFTVIHGHSERRHISTARGSHKSRFRGAGRGMTPSCVSESRRVTTGALESRCPKASNRVQDASPATKAECRRGLRAGMGHRHQSHRYPQPGRKCTRPFASHSRSHSTRKGGMIRILYGSVTPDNVDSLLGRPNIDGALVGGASLKADSFARIIRAKVG